MPLGCGSGSGCHAAGTAFTYRGRLQQNGSPVDGTVNMAIGLWDAATDGNPIGPIADPAPVQVTNGLFVVTLDYGNVFNGDARWLEVSVNGTTLSPRQPISGVPYALHTRGLSVDDVGEVGSGANAITYNRLFLLGTGSMNTLTLKSDRGPNYSHVKMPSPPATGTSVPQTVPARSTSSRIRRSRRGWVGVSYGQAALRGGPRRDRGQRGELRERHGDRRNQQRGVRRGDWRTRRRAADQLAASGRGVVGESIHSAGVGKVIATPAPESSESDSGIGVRGESSGSGTGIEGTSNGVFGQGIAVHGIAKRTGMAGSGRGVVGESIDSTGVYGKMIMTSASSGRPLMPTASWGARKATADRASLATGHRAGWVCWRSARATTGSPAAPMRRITVASSGTPRKPRASAAFSSTPVEEWPRRPTAWPR